MFEGWGLTSFLCPNVKYALLYKMPSNPKGKKLRLKNPMLLAIESEGVTVVIR